MAATVALFLNAPLAFSCEDDHPGVPAATLVGVAAPAGPAVRTVSAATAPTSPAVALRLRFMTESYHNITLRTSQVSSACQGVPCLYDTMSLRSNRSTARVAISANVTHA